MCALNEMPNEILLRILSHLGFEELVCLSDTTKRLREVVIDEGLLNHEDVDLTVQNTPARLYVMRDFFRIIGRGIILSFLRIFGKSIRELRLDFTWATLCEIQAVFSYVNRYCENLEVIRFFKLRGDLGSALGGSFQEIEFVHFAKCEVPRELCQFRRWFPKLDAIRFDQSSILESKALVFAYENEVYKSDEGFYCYIESNRVFSQAYACLRDPHLRYVYGVEEYLETRGVRESGLGKSSFNLPYQHANMWF